MNVVCAFEFGSVANGGGELDNRRLVLDSLSLSDGSLDCSEVIITISDVDTVPAIGLESLQNIFSEGAVGITVLYRLLARLLFLMRFSARGDSYDGDMIVVIDTNQVTQLQVTSSGRGLGSDTLHETPITKEHIGVIVD